MRKLLIYALIAASLMMAGTASITAYGAVSVHIIPEKAAAENESFRRRLNPFIFFQGYSMAEEEITEETETDLPEDEILLMVLEQVNQEREKAGVGCLTWNESLAQAATARTLEIETVFSHTRPDGSEFSTVYAEKNISFLKAGENIAYGQKTVKEVMEDWMNSEGHKANILNSQFTSIGIGHHVGQNGIHYWTQLFLG